VRVLVIVLLVSACSSGGVRHSGESVEKSSHDPAITPAHEALSYYTRQQSLRKQNQEFQVRSVPMLEPPG
jgi:hypothetical protein